MDASPLSILPALSGASLDPSAVFARARAARLAYEDAVSSDGVSARAWRRIAAQMHDACVDLVELKLARDTGAITGDWILTAGQIQCLADRQTDALHRAQYAERMLEVARNGRVIDMATLQGGAP